MEGQRWNMQNSRIISMQGTKCDPGVWSCLWIKLRDKESNGINAGVSRPTAAAGL